MATRRFSLAAGKTAKDVVEAAGIATVTKEGELTLDLAVVTKKSDALRIVDQIGAYIKSMKKWPPA